MTARAEYTSDEWALLLATPQTVAVAVAFADGGGFFETVGETVMASVAQIGGKERHPDNELIAALIDHRERIDPARLPQPQQVGETAEDVRRRLQSLAIGECREATALLAERSNAGEAAGYAAWVMEVAKAAAVTARHREGLFGAKGPAVDVEERTLLTGIADALNTDAGELPVESPAGPVDPS